VLLLALASSALTLSACGTDGKLGGAPPLVVKVPTTCERILAPVALPDVKPTDDARVAFVRDDAALIRARSEIYRGRHCIHDQRLLYATPAKR
jgi:hypothetical protein